MLVRVSYTKAEGLVNFDDAISRTTRNLHFEDWGEFLVAWRRDSIEIYRDHVCFPSWTRFVIISDHGSFSFLRLHRGRNGCQDISTFHTLYPSNLPELDFRCILSPI